MKWHCVQVDVSKTHVKKWDSELSGDEDFGVTFSRRYVDT